MINSFLWILFYVFSNWFPKAWDLSTISVSYSTKLHRLTTCYMDNYALFFFWKFHLTGVFLPSSWQSWFYKHICLPSNVLFPDQILLDQICMGFLAYFSAVFCIFITFLWAVGQVTVSVRSFQRVCATWMSTRDVLCVFGYFFSEHFYLCRLYLCFWSLSKTQLKFSMRCPQWHQNASFISDIS